MSRFLHSVFGIEEESAARITRYSYAAGIGIVAGLFFMAAAQILFFLVAKILSYVA